MPSARDLDWDRDRADWPNAPYSRFLRAGRLRWHVQIAGAGPALLLLHGTGASSHSWAGMVAGLARDFTVVAPDLPGHGFTGSASPYGLSLPGMAHGIGALLDALDIRPVLGVGHSAGAAILARCALDGRPPLQALISLNGALVPFDGVAGRLFSPLAKLLAINPVTPGFLARRLSRPAAFDRLIASTGSSVDAQSSAIYRRLAASPRHVAGTLGMMANWDLRRLARDLPDLTLPLVLVAASGDRTVPPGQASDLAARIPTARLERLPWGGHLAHEERPEEIVALVRRLAAEFGILPGCGASAASGLENELDTRSVN
ncbi:alpha/beta fold hydrolase BchO [Thalassobaculum sp. OXR-137]|uniref:alpha/beta fold hydrolase BchO n=1 Tax=Thalassobaculum sp. OXR-137 TaxID=3100173 RepID=UPI002AC996D7|nr:alpha/beta fold hydrolase BchO [Thalassobaculum sp. OXR-137]WPZ36799.1 alpha/beta fold hydrolase BchO [Thalassobaculum sp. OXR-137]